MKHSVSFRRREILKNTFLKLIQFFTLWRHCILFCISLLFFLTYNLCLIFPYCFHSLICSHDIIEALCTLFWNIHLQIYSTDINELNENTCWSWPYCILKKECAFCKTVFIVVLQPVEFWMPHFILVSFTLVLLLKPEHKSAMRKVSYVWEWGRGGLVLCQNCQPLCAERSVWGGCMGNLRPLLACKVSEDKSSAPHTITQH